MKVTYEMTFEVMTYEMTCEMLTYELTCEIHASRSPRPHSSSLSLGSSFPSLFLSLSWLSQIPPIFPLRLSAVIVRYMNITINFATANIIDQYLINI